MDTPVISTGTHCIDSSALLGAVFGKQTAVNIDSAFAVVHTDHAAIGAGLVAPENAVINVQGGIPLHADGRVGGTGQDTCGVYTLFFLGSRIQNRQLCGAAQIKDPLCSRAVDGMTHQIQHKATLSQGNRCTGCQSLYGQLIVLTAFHGSGAIPAFPFGCLVAMLADVSFFRCFFCQNHRGQAAQHQHKRHQHCQNAFTHDVYLLGSSDLIGKITNTIAIFHGRHIDIFLKLVAEMVNIVIAQLLGDLGHIQLPGAQQLSGPLHF